MSSTDTVLFHHNSSMWLDKDASSWDRKPLNFTLDLVLYYSASKRPTSARELLGIML